MRLLDRVHLVGSGNLGFDLTDPFDCHVYLVNGGSDLALIDGGCGVSSEAILGNVQGDGFNSADIGHILLTHGHADHAGGAADLRRRLDSPDVGVSRAVAEALASADTKVLSVDAAKEAGRYPVDYPFEPCAVDVPLDDGARISIGDVELEVITTPGHSIGDVCFLLADGDERVLFTGDLLFYGGTVLLQNMWDSEVGALTRSLRKLRDLDVTVMLPGHFSITLRDGQRHIERANLLLDQLRLPEPPQMVI